MLVLEVPYCLRDSLCLNSASSSTETNLRPGSQAPTHRLLKGCKSSLAVVRIVQPKSPDNDDKESGTKINVPNKNQSCKVSAVQCSDK